MKHIKELLRRPFYGIASIALVIGVAAPVLIHGFALADGQIQNRSIEMSSAVPGKTGVTYKVSFDLATAMTNPDVVVEFCSDTPLIAAACNFSTTANSNTVPILTGAASSAGTFASLGSGNVARVSNVTGTFAAGGTVTFDLTNVTNPAQDPSVPTKKYTSFYARIYVYPSGAAATDYTAPAASGSAPNVDTNGDTVKYTDYGGIAMSTVNTINITARVMESLSMCTSKNDLSNGNYTDFSGAGVVAANGCGDTTNALPPNIEIGHGSPTKVITADQIDMTPAYFQLSTNATHGAIVRMRATNSCAQGGITTDPTGADCSAIPAINSGATTPSLMTAGTASFGLFVSNSQLTKDVSGSTGTITPDTAYNDTTTSPTHTYSNGWFAMSTDPSTGVTSTYGSPIAACTGPVNQVNTQLVFAATASLTTPAGIYTGGESLIATGTF